MSAFFAQHALALRDALRRLGRAPLGSALSLFVIAIALALPCAGWLFIDNLRAVTGGATGAQQISIFMAVDANARDAAEIETRLRALKAGDWRFVSRDAALKRLQGAEGMAEIIASLPRNPLPDAFIVEPADAHFEQLDALAKTFAAWPKVEHVQLDSAWVKRFDAFLRVGRLATLLLAGLFAVALVAVTFNTIRLQIMAQSAEIEVARLIGATKAFIRRPFAYFGACQGALGALLAALLVNAATWVLAPPVGELAALYGGNFALRGLNAGEIALLALFGAILGWLGARISVAIHLRRG